MKDKNLHEKGTDTFSYCDPIMPSCKISLQLHYAHALTQELLLLTPHHANAKGYSSKSAAHILKKIYLFVQRAMLSFKGVRGV